VRVLILAAVLGGTAQAEVVDCPKLHAGQRLVGAGMFHGANKDFELMGGRKKVLGGYDVDFGFNGGEVKGVACWYGKDTSRWYQVSPAAKQCDLRERTTTAGQVTVKITCR